MPAITICDECGNEAVLTSCGCYVCKTCGNHWGLTRCAFCGWTREGEKKNDS